MGFICQAKFTQEQLPSGEVIFVRWINEAWDRKLVKKGEVFAHVRDSDLEYGVALNCGGILHKQYDAAPGDVIHEGETFAEFVTDGEEIPYGDPYCILIML